MAIRVGRWDCSTCGHKGNYGPKTSCANCGAPRPKNVRFYLPEKEEIVTDEARLKEAREGPDWRCGHCGGSNKARERTCTSCGNARDIQSGDETYLVQRLPSSPIQNEISTGMPASGRPFRKLLKVAGTIIGVIVLFILTAVACRRIQFYPVDGFRWERQTEMENYTWVTHETWDYPTEGELLASFEAIHHYDHVYVRTETRTRDVQVKVGEQEYVCGQRDMGNGYFEDEYCSESIYETQTETYQEDIYEDVPVYQMKYRYRKMEWIFDHTITSDGSDHTPVWPVELHPADAESWREGQKQEKFWIILKDEDEELHEELVPFNYWQQLKPGDGVPVTTYFGIWGSIDEVRAGIRTAE